MYRLITRKSFEAEMFDKASKKLGLEQAIMGSRAFNEEMEDSQKNTANKFDAKEMEQLLREGAYAVFKEDNADAIKEFFEQDIDTLLGQRAHVIRADAVDGTTGEGEAIDGTNNPRKLPRAKKSFFTGESAQEFADIDVNDPNFWKKVLPDLVTPESMLERLKDEFQEDEDGEEDYRERAEKFMGDMENLMLGILDLQRKNTLPDRERSIVLKLLLRLTLFREEVFSDSEIARAHEWLAIIEGIRSRRPRVDIIPSASATPASGKKKSMPGG